MVIMKPIQYIFLNGYLCGIEVHRRTHTEDRRAKYRYTGAGGIFTILRYLKEQYFLE